MTEASHETASDSTPTTGESVTRFKPLRVLLPIFFIVGMIVCRFIPGLMENGPAHIWAVSAFGPALCAIAILLWWLLLSRATWQERIAGFFGIIAIAAITMGLLHKSMLGPGLLILTIPMGLSAFAVGTIFFGNQLSFRRTTVGLLLACLGFGFSTLLTNDGVWGDYKPQFHWRWMPTAEDQLVANQDARAAVDLESLNLTDIESVLADPEWPGFRGKSRMGIQSGLKFSTDWNSTPPTELWRIEVGPAWSSFAVAGNLLFTQEQRGDTEAIVCYDANSGSEVWKQGMESRFFDPLGGPGPRATPILSRGMLFVQGAEGWLLRLDPKTGDIIWKQDIRDIADLKTAPMWGFSASPLVAGDHVITYGGGNGTKGTLAFDVESGEPTWSAETGKMSYSSPQLCTIHGTEYIAMLSNHGMELLDPSTGEERLVYEWEHDGYRACQPQVIGDSILIPTGKGTGSRLITIAKEDDGLLAEEVWTSLRVKPDFNDFVVHDGYIYGFDNSVLVCVSLESGERQWKGGRYGSGQVLLLADTNALLVASEFGDVVLVATNPEKHEEIAKFKAIEGKTWNHPVVVGNRLFIRNSQEAVCYELPVSSG